MDTAHIIIRPALGISRFNTAKSTNLSPQTNLNSQITSHNIPTAFSPPTARNVPGAASIIGTASPIVVLRQFKKVVLVPGGRGVSVPMAGEVVLLLSAVALDGRLAVSL